MATAIAHAGGPATARGRKPRSASRDPRSRSRGPSPPQPYDTADVYGINIQSTGWYVKLCIDHDTPEVAVISFHPPEHPMRTPAGVVKPP